MAWKSLRKKGIAWHKIALLLLGVLALLFAYFFLRNLLPFKEIFEKAFGLK